MTALVTVAVSGLTRVRVSVTAEAGGEVVSFVQGDGGVAPKNHEFALSPGALIQVGPEAAYVPEPAAEPPKAATAKGKEKHDE